MANPPHLPLTNYTDLLLDAICLVDAEGRFVYASAACESIFGYSPQEIVGRTVAEMVHPDDRERTTQAAREVRSGDSKLSFENRYIRKDGKTVHIMWSARWSEVDQLRIAVARDVTERKHAELMQHALYAIAEAANAAEDPGVLFKRVDGIISALVPAAGLSVVLKKGDEEALTCPYRRGPGMEPAGPGPSDAPFLSDEAVRTGEVISACMVPGKPGVGPSWSDVGDGTGACLAVPLNSRTTTLGALLLQSGAPSVPYTEKDRELLEFVATQLVAAMERVGMQARLHRMALYDHLTGLPNRQLLYDRLATALTRARREHRILAILFIDLDRLKQVNDEFGHAMGDELLRATADRLARNLRATDTVARLGGDEFAVLLEGLNNAEYAYEVAGKIEAILMQPVELLQQMVECGASVGVALFPDHGSDEREHAHSCRQRNVCREAAKATADLKTVSFNRTDGCPGQAPILFTRGGLEHRIPPAAVPRRRNSRLSGSGDYRGEDAPPGRSLTGCVVARSAATKQSVFSSVAGTQRGLPRRLAPPRKDADGRIAAPGAAGGQSSS